MEHLDVVAAVSHGDHAVQREVEPAAHSLEGGGLVDAVGCDVEPRGPADRIAHVVEPHLLDDREELVEGVVDRGRHDARRMLPEELLEGHLARSVEVPVRHALGVEPEAVGQFHEEAAARQERPDALEHAGGVEGLDVRPHPPLGRRRIAAHRDRAVRAHHVLGGEAELLEHRRGRRPRAAGCERDEVSPRDRGLDGCRDRRVDRLVLVHDRAVDVECDEPAVGAGRSREGALGAPSTSRRLRHPFARRATGSSTLRPPR
jgi:hypothetical protein